MNSHLSQDELLDQMYGVGAKEAHLRECVECSSRLQALVETKARLRAAASSVPGGAVSSDFLASQRRAIYARLDQSAAVRVRWAPALAVACLLAMSVFLYRPHPQDPPARPAAPAIRVELSNQQLFSDLYSMEQSMEPRAAAPIHVLFEETADGEQ